MSKSYDLIKNPMIISGFEDTGGINQKRMQFLETEKSKKQVLS